MATVAASSLNFRVFHCSSQDPQFPVNELLNMSNSIITLINLQIRTLHYLEAGRVKGSFLIHQNKIPSKIELFSYTPDFAAGAGALVSTSNPSISFTRLGHFSLDDNVRTNYQARELKTVYLEQYCQYLKVVMYKNHLNSFNIFNQVGLVSLSCVGSYMGEYEVGMISSKAVPQSKVGFPGDFQNDPNLMPRNMKITSLNEQELDPTIQDKLRILNSAKQKAVESDDFDKAKSLKEVIDKLKVAGSQLLQMEIQKKLAIENEDFDSAKVLKYEIDRLRQLAMTLDTDRVILTPIRGQTRGQPFPSGAGVTGDQYNEGFEDMRSQRPQMEGVIVTEGNQDEINDRGDPLEESKEEGRFNLKPGDRSFKDDRMSDRSAYLPSRNYPRNNEDLIVPALNMKKPIDFNTVGDDDFNGGAPKTGKDGEDEELKIQNIPQSQRPIADAMLPLFGEPTTLLVFGKTWQNREQGIGQVINKLNEVLAKDAENNSNTCVLQLMTECLKDKVQQVSTKTFQLVEAYVSALQKHKSINPKSENSNTEKMLTQLLDKLADSKFTQKTEKTYLKFFDVDQFDGGFLIGFLLKNNSYINQKMATSFKHIVPRMNILNTILTDFQKYEGTKKISGATFPFTALFGKVKEGIEASSQEQRKASLLVLTTVYQKFGFKKVEPIIGELNIKSLELLIKDVPEVETYIKMKKQTKKE